MNKKHLSIFVLVIAALLIAPMSAFSQPDEDILRYPILAEPEHLNPFISDTIAISTVISNVYEGLTRYNPITGEVDPALAESWEVGTDDEGRQTFTYFLREGVMFHDIAQVDLTDREVTADDILWNYELALNEDEDISIKANELSNIVGAEAFTVGEAETVEGLEVIDDYTFRITLDNPDRLFLINGSISITSPEAYEQLGDSFTNTPVGTGPFQFVEWLRNDHLDLTANPDYWLPEFPLVDGIRFISFGDDNTALLSYAEGDLDFLFRFPSGQYQATIDQYPEEFSEKPGLHLRYWGFNMETGFFAENPLVRQAFMHTLDRETAWNVIDEGSRFPADLGMLPPSMPASTPSAIYEYDLERAAELLEEAGFPNGEGMPTVVIHLLEVISGEGQVVLWQQDLESLGINVEFDVQAGDTYWDSIVEDETMIFQNGWAAGLVDPSDIFNFLILDGRGSMRYDNPEVNDLLNQALAELDPEAREALYQQVHDIVMEDAVVIPSAYSKVTWLQKPWVEGFVPGGGGTYTAPLWQVSIAR